jgi:hypothetical protein
MPPGTSGSVDSGLDRGLQWALEHRLDEYLETGLLPDEENKPVEIPVKLLDWQRRIGEDVGAPGAGNPIIPRFWERIFPFLDPLKKRIREVYTDVRNRTRWRLPEPPKIPERTTTFAAPVVQRKPDRDAKESLTAAANKHDTTAVALDQWRFRDNLTGIVMIHGIGPQLAGQTLLDWTQPIITLIRDAVVADRTGKVGDGPRLAAPDPRTHEIDDPVYRANIDFSGETFPVVHVRIPRLAGDKLPPGADEADERKWRASEPRWIFSETWWASEVRPPSLRTMVGWLGEQGGVGRIVQGIQQNTFGKGPLHQIARLSVQPFVSVIVSFALLLLIAALTISRFIPIASIRSAVTLRLASAFLTDWFGGARTLLRDPAQSANVRHRLVMTIKALRAYGCRRVIIVAHSGGTIVSLTTLTDPAYPKLEVDKLITIGEALNLGWRLEAADPDAEHPVPPDGHRLWGDLSSKTRLLWRDFYGTHDPASSGAPDPPAEGMKHNNRFATERTYNRMSIGGDHGAYWDNDEQFLIPLIREIDVPNGDRTTSRFYSDKAESFVRSRRKERVSWLRMWRRATSALPIMAILAAAVVTSFGSVKDLGRATLGLLKNVPFSTELTRFGNQLADLMDAPERPVNAIYGLGLLVLQLAFVLAVLQALIPSRSDALWWKRRNWRIAIRSLDLALGPVVFVAILFALWQGSPDGLGAIGRLVGDANLALFIGVGIVVFILAEAGRRLRKELRDPKRRLRLAPPIVRGLAIVASALFLAALLILLALASFGVVLVYAGKADPTQVAQAESTKLFVVGGVAVVLLFRLLQRLGEWRWDAWDVRERRQLRRDPKGDPPRGWPTLIALLFTVIVFAAAIVVAGGKEWHLLGWTISRDWLLMFVIGAIGASVLLVISKDVVDNDVDTDGRLTGSSDQSVISPPPAKGPGEA